MLTATVCYGLSGLALLLAAFQGFRRRGRSAVRWLGLALLPAGLYLTGLVPVGRTIGHELAHWARELVLDPRVWTGIGLLAGGVLLLLLSGLGRSKAAPPAPKQQRPAAQPGAAQPGLAQPGAAPKAVAPAPPAGNDLGDFSDIEDILRKRGI
ncbi:hypothetical protein C7C46_23010 [Streptomyces tateyamensis]|uniref:Cellulose synthase n=1 Tax=Streptomyces tateyamensis TaxID=565073 RepID=A0A2V4NL60_9ACTN|nr:hypothetical protein [Streptomyces tateyamensis]PYC76343.1 hypothetical protein C7C46_23010 [Streptomyces tateyamensis]